MDADQRWLRVGRLRFQRGRTAHHSQPLVHEFTADNADGIVLCTGRSVDNGNIVDRAAPGALKFINGTLPRLICHDANHAPAANARKTEYCAMSLLVAGCPRVVGSQVRSAVVSFAGTHDSWARG